jgi:hypothetical protein
MTGRHSQRFHHTILLTRGVMLGGWTELEERRLAT